MIVNKGGKSGLINLGNSCFMNTAIQCLGHIDSFREFILSNTFDETSQKLCYQFKRVLNGLWENDCTVNPVSFFKTIKQIAKKDKLNINFTNNNQNDIHEFLIFILEIMESEVKDTHDYFKNNMYGKYTTIIKNKTKTKMMSKLDTSFITLMLPIKDTLNECIVEYLKDEYLENENKWFNEKTNTYEEIYKKFKIKELPNELIISFNRFTNMGLKINTNIDFPITMKLNNENYQLVSVANHSGNMFGGHYYASVYHKDKWYTYNDASVTEMGESNIISPDAYILFYKKN